MKTHVKLEQSNIDKQPQFNSSSTDAKFARVQVLLKEISRSWFSHSSEVEELTKLLSSIETENQTTSKKIDDSLDAALKDVSQGGLKLTKNEREAITKLQGERKSKREALDRSISEQRTDIIQSARSEQKEFIKDDDKLSRLANLDGDYIVSDTARDFVSEKDLKQAISRAAGKDQKNLDTVYKGVTGEDPNWSKSETFTRFQDDLRIQLAVMREITGGGNAGLEAILQGKTTTFIHAIKKKVGENGGKPLEIKTLKESTRNYNMAGAVGTFIVALLTAGLVTFGTEKHNVDAEEIMKAFERQSDGKFKEKTNVLRYIKDAFMGRRLSLSLGEERIAGYTAKIIDFAEKVMNIDPKSPPTESPLKEAFASAMRLKPTPSPKEVQKSIIQSYIIGEGYKNEGSNWFASIGLLMLVGAHRDEVSVKSEKTGETEFTKAEQEVTRDTMEKTDYEKVDIKVERQRDGTYKYTIPKELALPDDAYKIPVKQIDGMIVEGGNYVLSKSTLHNLSLKRTGTQEYTVVLTPSTAQDRITKAPDIINNQLGENAKDLREGFDMSTLSGQIFWITRNKTKFPTFNIALKHISDGEYEKAYTALKNEKEAKTVAQGILRALNIDTTKTGDTLGAEYAKLQAVNTYKYGVRAVMTGTNDVTKKTYAEVRPATIKGEQKLLSNEYNTSNEEEFATKEKHTAIQLSDKYQNQQLSVTVAATPRGGNHVKDKYTGSLQVSDQILTSLNDTQQANLLTDHAKKVTTEFEKFKKFVIEKVPNGSDVSTITEEKYKEYLKTRDLPIEWKKLGIGETKKPSMFESRAMAQGNRCMNYTVGIAYPLFAITVNGATTNQSAEAVVNVEGSTPLNIQNVQNTRHDIGINTIGFIKGLANKNNSGNQNGITGRGDGDRVEAPPAGQV